MCVCTGCADVDVIEVDAIEEREVMRLLSAGWGGMTDDDRNLALVIARQVAKDDALDDIAAGGGDDPASPRTYYGKVLEAFLLVGVEDGPEYDRLNALLDEWRECLVVANCDDDPRVQEYIRSWNKTKVEAKAAEDAVQFQW
jgi:hypothetical protein